MLRESIIRKSDVFVFKVGTNVLSQKNGLLNQERIDEITQDLSKIMDAGKKVILVSSGAVGAGMGRLGLTKRPKELPQLQAVAAIGQCELMESYERSLRRFGRHAAQMLLTADDLAHRKRYMNATNTLRCLLDFGVLPIINENDTVSVTQLHTTFGDNDRLASLVANLFQHPLLVLLTDVQGLYDRDPCDPEAQFIPLIEKWTANIMAMAAEKKSIRSKGGMSSKLNAAKMITEAGGNVLIANGDQKGIISDIFDAKDVGTLFLSQGGYLSARKRWIGFAVRPTGTLVLDEGAIQAVCDRGHSLLPIGILRCVGKFEKGDIVSLVDTKGNEVARGLTNYAYKEAALIIGQKSHEIKTILGHCLYSEIVHCDNIQITR